MVKARAWGGIVLCGMLAGCGAGRTDDLGEILGEGIKGQSLSGIYTLYESGRLSPSERAEPFQTSWRGFERQGEETVEVLLAPLAEGGKVWGEERVTVVVRPSRWQSR